MNKIQINEIEVKCAIKIHELTKKIGETAPAETYSGCFACSNSFATQIIVDNRNICEVEITGGVHTEFYAIISDQIQEPINIFDEVILQIGETHEIAYVKTPNSEIIKLKRQKSGLYGEELPILLRKINQDDIKRKQQNKRDEEKAKEAFKSKSKKFNLEMKLVDVHYQFDRSKLYFFYTADGRIDFRELAKDLAAQFKTRIELRQIGVRDEAKKVGGIGTCGREYCCSSFMDNFKRISTQLASDQNLSTNMTKLSGPCGKLKCCLMFEYDQYLQVIKDIQKEESSIETTQ